MLCTNDRNCLLDEFVSESFLPKSPRRLLEWKRGQSRNIDRNWNDSPRQCLSLKRSSDHHPKNTERRNGVPAFHRIIARMQQNLYVCVCVCISHPSRPNKKRAGMLGLAVLPSVTMSRYWLSLSSALSAIRTAFPPASSTFRAFCTKEQPLKFIKKKKKKKA